MLLGLWDGKQWQLRATTFISTYRYFNSTQFPISAGIDPVSSLLERRLQIQTMYGVDVVYRTQRVADEEYKLALWNT